MKITFGLPEDGWMEVVIVNGNKKYTEIASDAYLDSLSKLVEILIDLASNQKEVKLDWFLDPLQPFHWLWNIKNVNDLIEFNFFLLQESWNGVGFDEKIINQFLITGLSKSIFLKIFYDSLKVLESKFMDNKINPNDWYYKFPSEKLKILEEKLNEN